MSPKDVCLVVFCPAEGTGGLADDPGVKGGCLADQPGQNGGCLVTDPGVKGGGGLPMDPEGIAKNG